MNAPIEHLRTALPHGVLVADPDLLGRYSHDPTGRFSGVPLAVARPRTVQELSAVLRACNEARIGVVPQGGNTGLVGGAIANEDELVLSLEHLSRVESVEGAAQTVVAEAGASLSSVQRVAGDAGLELPIDFAARDAATIGGMVATDAGGALAMRHGSMRHLVAGLRVVLANGTVLDHLDRPSKDSSGFDVTRLLCGSEGTLGVVAAARLKLVRRPSHRTVALIGTESLEAAVTLTARLRVEVEGLEAAEFFLARGLDLVMGHGSLPSPFPRQHEAFLLVSVAADSDPGDDLAAALDVPEARDVAVAQSPAQREGLWRYRELHNAAINAAGVPHKLDVAVRPERVPELVARVDRWLAERRPGATGVHYGHLGDGNVHVNVLGPPPEDDEVDEAVLRIVADMGGSISAEHGIGRAKTRWLHLTRSGAEIEAMKAIKRALDPHGILNPGKLLPTP